MRWFLTAYLIVTGALAALVLVIPGLVVLGLFALVLPGLILAAMPTAFFYGALFAAGWFPLRNGLGPIAASAGGLAVVALVAFGVPALANRAIADRVAEARRQDREPTRPLAVSGVLRIEQRRSGEIVPATSRDDRPSFRCDDLCAAALFTPQINAVTLADPLERSDGAVPARHVRPELTTTYRLSPQAAGADCPEPRLPRESSDRLGRWPEVETLRTAWILALSAGTCIVRDPVGPSPAPDWTLELDRDIVQGSAQRWSFGPQMRARRLVLANRTDEVLRRTSVDVSRLRDVLWIEPTGGLENFAFGWSRRGDSEGGYGTVDLLARTTTLGLTPAAATVGAPTGADVRARLTAALDDHALPAGSAAFSLVRLYLKGFGAFGRKPDVRDGDVDLLARLIADGRARDFFGIHDAIKAVGPRAAALREPMIARVLTARVPEDREPARLLGGALASLPADLFATPTPDELRLLADDERRRWAGGLVRRQADRGGAAGPDLVRIIAQAYTRPLPTHGPLAGDRLDDAEAAVQALCLLGPEAADVLPNLEALIEAGVVPSRVLDERTWQLTLARLGKPVESFMKPINLSGTQDSFQANVQNRLTRFRPNDCR